MEKWMIVHVLPLEVWMDIFCFPWITRAKFGQLVARIGNLKFAEHAQFYLHEWGKRKLNDLHFTKNGFYKYMPYAKHMDFPLAPMPDKIISFECITIKHFDAKKLAFLRQIRAILTNVDLHLGDIPPLHKKNLRTVLAHVLPLLDGVHSLSFDLRALPSVRHCFGDKLAKIKMLEIKQYEMHGTGRQQATLKFLMNWLVPQQQEDIGPRWCEVGMYRDLRFSAQISTAIRQEFLAATTPCTFAFSLRPFWTELHFAEFHLENSIGEQLHGVQTAHGHRQSRIQITRHRANCGTALEAWVKENTKEMISGGRQIRINSPTIGLLAGMDAPKSGGRR